MTAFTPEQQRVLQKSLAKAQFIWALGESGVMAMNPKMIKDSFERLWNENSLQSRTVKDAAKWIVEFMANDPAVETAFVFVLEDEVEVKPL